MKKYIALILCILLIAISVVACASKDDGNDTDSEAPSQSVEQSETESDDDDDDDEEYTAPIFGETDSPEVTVDEKELGEAGEDGEGDWSGYYPKN